MATHRDREAVRGKSAAGQLKFPLPGTHRPLHAGLPLLRSRAARYWAYVVGVFIMGLGYGVVQPVIYDKTAYVAPTAAKSTAYFSYLLTCNYVSISIVPFIIGAAKRIFDARHDVSFSFFFNGAIMAILLIVSIICRKSFVFKVIEPVMD